MEECVSNLEKARADIEDALTVMAHLKKRQCETLKAHAEFMTHHDIVMREMEDKLNTLISIVVRREGGPEALGV